MDIDKIIREWFFKLPMGYAEQPYSEDELQTLAEVLVEHKVDLPLFEATYKDNSENRKLGRVGQEWGTGKDAKPINKDTKKDSEEPKISKDDIPKEDPKINVDRSKFDEKDKKHKDNPKGPTRKEVLDDMNAGNLDVLTEFQNGVQTNRALGIAGPGGAVASEGESKYCKATNTDFDKFDSDNKEAILKKEKEIEDRPKTKQDSRTAKALGLEPDSPEFNTYLAKREVWVLQQREKAKSDPNSVFHKKGKKGFNSNDEAYDEWMETAFDGALSTKQSIEESSIDTSKPNVTVQSTPEADQAVEAHLEDNLKNAKTPEDREYAEKQLKNFSKFKSYHDTYVIGKDAEGRTTYMGISNKKDDQIRDPQNNTSPSKRFHELEAKYGPKVAKEVIKSLQENIKKVDEVKENTVKAASDIKITDDFVAVCESEEMKPYIKKLRESSKFRTHLKKNGLDPDKMNTKELLIAMNAHSKKLAGEGKRVSYTTYGKIAIKVGEFAADSKFKRDNPKLNFNDESVKASVKIKQTEKDVVKSSHTAAVNDLIEADKPDGYSKDNPDADNGPHQAGYIGGVLDACHIDTYIDMDSDDGMLLQTGINGIKPSMIRECVAEKSGFKGDSSTAEGKAALKSHLRKRCRVQPGGDRITIDDGGGKGIELFDDTWRTAGTSQKVATGFGKGMRKCLQAKAAK